MKPPKYKDCQNQECPPEKGCPRETGRGRRTRAACALVALALVAAVAACGCGRKAKPEPLWSATRLLLINDRSR